MFPDFFHDDVARLETSRLWLRWPAAGDNAAIVKHLGDYEVTQHTARIPHPYPADAADSFIRAARCENAEGRGVYLALALRQRPGSLVGLISLECMANPDMRDVAILGYWLGRPYWGDGIMGEAVTALLDFIWIASNIAEISASVMVENGRSRRVLEKCGFVKTHEEPCHAPARGGSVPAVHFASTRSRPRFGHERVCPACVQSCF